MSTDERIAVLEAERGERREKAIAAACDPLYETIHTLLKACKAARDFGSKGETDDGRSVSGVIEDAIAKATEATR